LLLLLVQELHNTGAAYTEASASNEDLQEESKQLRRQLKSSMALNEKVQAELQRVTDIEAEKYAGDKADRTAAYFELESTLHKTRAEKTKLVRENKQLHRKLEKIESANSGAAAQGILTDGGWCVSRPGPNPPSPSASCAVSCRILHLDWCCVYTLTAMGALPAAGTWLWSVGSDSQLRRAQSSICSHGAGC
jgi:hypothetical protein